MNIKIDINVCRVCLKSGEGEGVPLFGAPANYNTKFTYITQLKVSKGDGLPELLCRKCLARLKIAHDFRVQAQSSQDHLRKFITDVNEKFKNVTGSDAEEGEDYAEEILDAAYEELDIKKPIKATPEPVSIVAASSPVVTRRGTGKVVICQATKKIVLQSPKTKKSIPAVVVVKQEIHDEKSHSEEEILDDQTMDGNQSEVEQANCEDQSQVDEEMYEEHIEEESVDMEPYNVEVDPIAKKPRKRRSRSEKVDDNHVCNMCNKDFSTRTNLLRHMTTHNGGKPYTCPICGNGFTQNGSLKQHMHIHTGHRPFQCEFCNRGFTQSKSLVFHMRRHTGEKPYTCGECNMSFRQKDGLKRHMAVKHSTEPKEAWACEVCGKVLQSKYSVNMHMRKHYIVADPEGADSDQYACNECDRVFGTQNALQAHERQHSIVTILKCDVCSMEFSSKAALLEHNLTHASSSKSNETADEMHECPVCSIKFKQVSHLNVHMSMQHSERAKQFACNICNKSYAIERNLEKHMRLHGNVQKMEQVEVLDDYELVIGDEDMENEAVEQCEICLLGFSSKEQLRQHQVDDHADELELLVENDALDICVDCPSCDMKFGDVSELNAHVLTEHDAIDSKCEICDEHFQSQRMFDEHRLEHDLTGK